MVNHSEDILRNTFLHADAVELGRMREEDARIAELTRESATPDGSFCFLKLIRGPSFRYHPDPRAASPHIWSHVGDILRISKHTANYLTHHNPGRFQLASFEELPASLQAYLIEKKLVSGREPPEPRVLLKASQPHTYVDVTPERGRRYFEWVESNQVLPVPPLVARKLLDSVVGWKFTEVSEE